ncbi:MAG TPA: hypothetical protein DEP53_05625 [Bacteroidetes bacterium]|nr:hypothetical protein [Bacteroidota bacterium]
MERRLFDGIKRIIPIIFLPVIAGGCNINDFDSDPNAEYRDSFFYTRSTGARTEFFIRNVNGELTIIGVDTLSEIRISGTRIVKDQTVDDARQHIDDIEIDLVESSSMLSVKTVQPNSSSGREYQVDYEVLVPSSWRVTANNVNGGVEIASIRNTVTTTAVNGSVNVTEIAGSTIVSLTNGKISGRVFLPENGTCDLSLVNGNVNLLVPRATSADVDATVAIGSVSVTNLPIVYTTDSRTAVSGVLGSGKGTIRLSSVNGIVQLIGF